LAIVCRDQRLGSEEAQRERQRDHWRQVVDRLRAERRLIEAMDVVHRCENSDEAEYQLGESKGLTRAQATHLLKNRNLRLLTRQGQQEIQTELDSAVRSLDSLEPSLDDNQ
jgi:DNA gyrase/topoisomerase IV subunit A